MITYDLVVIGTGGVGSGALYYAARRGLRVLGLDRFPPGHDRGSSHGETRAIRMAYFEHPDYVPLLRLAYRAWEELEAITGQRLFCRVGLLEIGPPDGEVICGVRRSAAEHGLPIATLDVSDVKDRFPGFRIPEGYTVLFEENAGFLYVEQCVKTHIHLAQQLGAEYQSDVCVQECKIHGQDVEVITNLGSVRAKYAVVAPGPWAPTLLTSLGLPLRLLRKHLHWYPTRSRHYHIENGCPVYFFELGKQFFYGFPQLDARGVKVAEHTGGEECTDPLSASRDPDPLDRQRVEQFLSLCMPDVVLSPSDHCVCFYTMTPDSHFVVDWHPDSQRIAYAVGLSGHGFKFTNILGRALVEMVVDGTTNVPVQFLHAGRWKTDT